MEEHLVLPDEVIVSKIYVIRGQKVMLDSDLASLYGVTTKVFNQAVKRNALRLPDDFMFRLSAAEFAGLRSQIVTSNRQKGGRQYAPFVFTEQGVAMLSGIINSERAIAIHIRIIRVFTRLRELLLEHGDILLKLETLDKKILHMGLDIHSHDGEIATIFELIRELIQERQQAPAPRTPIGFKTAAGKGKAS